MKKIVIVILIVITCCITMYILLNKKNNSHTNNTESTAKEEIQINIKINNEVFKATLVNNETTQELVKTFPVTLKMEDLNDNEKYIYLDKNLPTDSYKPNKINKGDIMLYGSNCLVIFYKTFSSSYSYTNIGKINVPENLEKALGSKNIDITFELIN